MIWKKWWDAPLALMKKLRFNRLHCKRSICDKFGYFHIAHFWKQFAFYHLKNVDRKSTTARLSGGQSFVNATLFSIKCVSNKYFVEFQVRLWWENEKQLIINNKRLMNKCYRWNSTVISTQFEFPYEREDWHHENHQLRTRTHLIWNKWY